MKFLLFASLIAALCLTSAAQTGNSVDEADAIKEVVGIIATGKKPKVDVVLRDLREVEGKIVGVYDDSFIIELKQKKNKRSITIVSIGNRPTNRIPPMTIMYRDVLQIQGKGIVLSVVPDPKLTPYSEWSAIPTVGVGAMLHVHTQDGKKTHGVFMKWADDRITIMQGNTRAEIARSEIVRIFHLAADTKPLANKIYKEGRKVGEVAAALMLPIIYLTLAYPAVGIGLAAAGVAGVVLMYVLPKGGVRGVLLYAA